MPIFDQGYQHWNGPLHGHMWRWLVIAWQGTVVQGRNRILRLLLLLAWLPALGLVGAVIVWGLAEQKSETVLGFVRNLKFPPDFLAEPRAFRSAVWTLAYAYFFQIEMYYIMLLVAVAGPGLISRDLRFNALPLYFARPLTRLDYFLGKLGVIGGLVASVAVGPAVAAYVIGVCFSLDLSVVRDTYALVPASIAYGLVITLSAGTLMLALSSLTRRSLYVGIAWAGLWIIGSTVAAVLTDIHRHTARAAAREAELSHWLAENPPPPGVRLIGTSVDLEYQPRAPRQWRPRGVQPGQEAAADRWYRNYVEASQRSWIAARVDEAEVSRRDWRPLCSYVGNLDRIGHHVFDTDAAWVSIGRAAEGTRKVFGVRASPAGERRLADQFVPQFPWTWSAGVLAALLGLSVWILTMRVKSLDRLR